MNDYLAPLSFYLPAITAQLYTWTSDVTWSLSRQIKNYLFGHCFCFFVKIHAYYSVLIYFVVYNDKLTHITRPTPLT